MQFHAKKREKKFPKACRHALHLRGAAVVIDGFSARTCCLPMLYKHPTSRFLSAIISDHAAIVAVRGRRMAVTFPVEIFLRKTRKRNKQSDNRHVPKRLLHEHKGVLLLATTKVIGIASSRLLRLTCAIDWFLGRPFRSRPFDFSYRVLVAGIVVVRSCGWRWFYHLRNISHSILSMKGEGRLYAG